MRKYLMGVALSLALIAPIAINAQTVDKTPGTEADKVTAIEQTPAQAKEARMARKEAAKATAKADKKDKEARKARKEARKAAASAAAKAQEARKARREARKAHAKAGDNTVHARRVRKPGVGGGDHRLGQNDCRRKQNRSACCCDGKSGKMERRHHRRGAKSAANSRINGADSRQAKPDMPAITAEK